MVSTETTVPIGTDLIVIHAERSVNGYTVTASCAGETNYTKPQEFVFRDLVFESRPMPGDTIGYLYRDGSMSLRTSMRHTAASGFQVTYSYTPPPPDKFKKAPAYQKQNDRPWQRKKKGR